MPWGTFLCHSGSPVNEDVIRKRGKEMRGRGEEPTGAVLSAPLKQIVSPFFFIFSIVKSFDFFEERF